MKHVNFYPKTFAEIPDQDNPAFYGDECLMIVKRDDHSRESQILHIKQGKGYPKNHVAIFWHEHQACKFCDMVEPDFFLD